MKQVNGVTVILNVLKIAEQYQDQNQVIHVFSHSLIREKHIKDAQLQKTKELSGALQKLAMEELMRLVNGVTVILNVLKVAKQYQDQNLMFHVFSLSLIRENLIANAQLWKIKELSGALQRQAMEELMKEVNGVTVILNVLKVAKQYLDQKLVFHVFSHSIIRE